MQDEKAESPVLTEYAAAKKEGRQPNCPYCGKPLELEQTRIETAYWVWNDDRKVFSQQTDCSASAPKCVNCRRRDWNFLDHDLVRF